MRNNFIFSILLIVSQVVRADSDFVLPTVSATEFEQQKIWNQYCVGERKSVEIPQPNYADSDILNAAKKLAMVSPYSYYFYSGPLLAYKLKKGKDLVDPPADFPKDIKQVKNGHKNSHAFLTLLCGEFRDRPTLIKEKINWVKKMYLLPDEPQKKLNINHDLWPQFTARSYIKYINTSKDIFAAKENLYKTKKYKTVLDSYVEDYPIGPFTVCETKFIFKKYVETGAEFSPFGLRRKNTELIQALTAYLAEYKKFKKRCSANDLTYFYNFRGDSNFKPNSPESNGMIWYSTTISNICQRQDDGRITVKSKMLDKVEDPEICEKYYKNPFAYRWSAARAGLATWILREETFDKDFSSEDTRIQIVPHLKPIDKPFGFKLPQKQSTEEQGQLYFSTLKQWENSQKEFWQRNDFGFNAITGLGTKTVNRNLAYSRLRDAVNRHTDWYNSGYDDGLGLKRNEAYSPLVASSYEMSASDGFTSPGVTVQSPSDGCKHWMFVFKLKLDQWYNTLSLQQKKPINFDRHWLDETSFGTNDLADSERALDRMGTALEGEMDSILYLHNITKYDEVNAKCGAEYME